MKSKILVLFVLLASLSLSDGLKTVWENKMEGKAVGTIGLYPLVSGGASLEINYKVYSDEKLDFMLGGGTSITIGKNHLKKFEENQSDLILNGGFYGDSKLKGKVVKNLSMYGGIRAGILLERTPVGETKPDFYGGIYTGLDYNHFVFELGVNTGNIFYIGLGGRF